MAPAAGIRLDYLLRIVDALVGSEELKRILGEPVEKHIVLLVEDGRFRFNALTPFGEEEKEFTEEEKARAKAVVEGVVKVNYPGTEGLPEVR